VLALSGPAWADPFIVQTGKSGDRHRELTTTVAGEAVQTVVVGE